MVISSRTPEGDQNRCPICGHAVRMEPSIDTRDAPCPHCGHLLWFDTVPAGQVVVTDLVRDADAGTLAEVLIRIGEAKFGKITEVERIALMDVIEKPRSIDVLPKFMAAKGWREAIEILGRK
jgi:DNA-directed RNA polymerase subunit RPC12/RpoP